MHELSVCSAIADAVRDRAAGRPVVSIQLRVGQLRQIVPDTLEFCWSIVSEQSDLTGSRLDIEHVPAVIECGDCGQRTELSVPVMACPACSGRLVQVVAGQEFLITSIELQDVAEPDGSHHPDEG